MPDGSDGAVSGLIFSSRQQPVSRSFPLIAPSRNPCFQLGPPFGSLPDDDGNATQPEMNVRAIHFPKWDQTVSPTRKQLVYKCVTPDIIVYSNRNTCLNCMYLRNFTFLNFPTIFPPPKGKLKIIITYHITSESISIFIPRVCIAIAK